MSAFTASAVASPGAAKVLASRRSVASRAPMMAARAPVAKFGARAPLSVSAKAGPSGEIKKVRARVIHDAHVDLSFERGWTRFHPRRGRPSTDEPSKPCSPHFIHSSAAPPLHGADVRRPDLSIHSSSSSSSQVVLAYSGGLDTSIILKWLQDTYGCEVITFTADLGQGEELEPARAKAEQMGVKQVHLPTVRYFSRVCPYVCLFPISSFLPIPNRFPIRTQIYIDDLREEFVRDYVFPMFRANAVYEGTYLLGTSIARPLISKRQIEIAKEVGADAVCHGMFILVPVWAIRGLTSCFV